MFLIIGITNPECWNYVEDEASAITEYLKSGALDFIHLRKKDASINYTYSLMNKIPSEWHKKIILHSHHSLFDHFHFGGLHSNCPIEYNSKYGFLTRSCHSLKECSENASPFFYSFLSPIFDSISKENYQSQFSLLDKNLIETAAQFPIVALGGIKPTFFKQIFESKFAGAALLGYLWSHKSEIKDKINILITNKDNLTNN